MNFKSLLNKLKKKEKVFILTNQYIIDGRIISVMQDYVTLEVTRNNKILKEHILIDKINFVRE